MIDNAVNEVIRWQTPIAHMRRTALENTEIAGRKIASGDKIVLWYASANYDERIFPQAEQFDIKRENARKNLAFGAGIHHCIGRRLAELQLRILFEAMIERWDRVEVAGAPVRTRSNFVHGYESLPVRIIA